MSERSTSGGLTNTDTKCPDDEEDLDPRIQVKQKRPPLFYLQREFPVSLMITGRLGSSIDKCSVHGFKNVLNLFNNCVFIVYMKHATFSTGCNNMYMRACNYLHLVLPLQMSSDRVLLLFPIAEVGVQADKTFAKQSYPQIDKCPLKLTITKPQTVKNIFVTCHLFVQD